MKVVAFLCLVLGVAAVPTPLAGESRLMMEPDLNSALLSEFDMGPQVDGNERIPLIFMLRHEAGVYETMDRLFWDVSNPKHEKYGDFLTLDQLAALTRVSPAKSATMLSWIQSFLPPHSDIPTLSATGDSITVSVPARAAQAMFQTPFHVYHHKKSADVAVVRAAGARYSLPTSIAQLVYMVEGVATMPRLSGPIVLLDSQPESFEDWPSDCGSQCAGYTTPQVLATRYNIQDSIPTPTIGNMSVAEFQGQYWDQDDLDKFASICGLEKVDISNQVGPNVPNQCSFGQCVEALLDIQYIKAVAGALPLTDVYASTYNLLDWATQLDSMANVPLVVSVSYGNDEAQQTGRNFIVTANAQFMKLGLRGVSVLFASGDQGVWGREGVSVFKKRYHPDFPAASPYITAVGGTDFVQKGVIGEEKSWSASGGGFSDNFAIPDWQSDAVANYKKIASDAGKLPSASLFNDTGRGYPDVSALGGQVNPYCIVSGTRVSGVAGTSASCPVVAGIIARLNEVRLQANKPPLGPLNQWIYSLNGQGFQDVTQGENKAMGPSGFAALKGWDPATGWGTPNYQELAKLV